MKSAFTLIEVLLAIGILAVLFTITLIAINPSRQFSQANNAKRRSDLLAILNGVNQYQLDNKGALPTSITTTNQIIRKTGGVDLCSLIIPTYVAALPVDPKQVPYGSLAPGTAVRDCAQNYNTNYSISKSATDSRLIVSAPGAELGLTISLPR